MLAEGKINHFIAIASLGLGAVSGVQKLQSAV